MNRLFVIAAMVVVLSGGLVSASPAHADPRITISSSKGASARPLQHRYNLRLPALRNAKPKARRTFTTIVRGVVDQQYRFLIKWRNRYNPTPQCNNRTKNSMFRARTRKGIIGRYAMATITVNTWPACGGVDHAVARTINLDLRTGRSLRLDNLIDRRAARRAVDWYVSYGVRTVRRGTCEASEYRRLNMYNWSLKRRGLQFWFDKYAVSYGYCGAVSVTVPWRDLPLTARGEQLAERVRRA